jgi:hypothetical protein
VNKILPPVPVLIIKSVKCSFYKDNEFILKTEPFFTIASNGKSSSTLAQKGNTRELDWNEQLRLKISSEDRINFYL